MKSASSRFRSVLRALGIILLGIGAFVSAGLLLAFTVVGWLHYAAANEKLAETLLIAFVPVVPGMVLLRLNWWLGRRSRRT